jgi:FtsP/CotA-like multicopper oxidase with cupredoxin domain
MMNHGAMQHHHHSMHHAGRSSIARAGNGSTTPISPLQKIDSVQIDMMADAPQYRLDDPGVGLRDHTQKYGRRVLTYADLCNLNPTPDPRDPTREIQLHLTGNMHRYLWSIDGVPYENAEPLQLRYGERVRITLVNNTMMNHPFHLHGMWSDLETGDAKYIPRKHTVIVQPGAKISYLVTADAYGRWAYHCHLMYHMMMMFREVHVA